MSDYQQERIVLFFRKHNSKIVSFAVVTVLAVVGMQWYVTQRTQEKQIGAENFTAFRSAYKAWTENSEKNKKGQEAVSELETRMQSLHRLFQGSAVPYSKMAELYKALIMVEDAKIDQLALTNVSLPNIQDPRAVEQVFMDELKYLVIAKALADSTDHAERGREMLTQLVTKGSVTSVPAAFSLAQLSRTLPTVDQAIRLIETAGQRQPWQADLLAGIQSELKQRKVGLKAAQAASEIGN